MHVQAGIGVADLDRGRVLRLEFLIPFRHRVYNASSGLKRLPFRGQWDTAFQDYVKELDTDKPVVAAGT